MHNLQPNLQRSREQSNFENLKSMWKDGGEDSKSVRNGRTKYQHVQLVFRKRLEMRQKRGTITITIVC